MNIVFVCFVLFFPFIEHLKKKNENLPPPCTERRSLCPFLFVFDYFVIARGIVRRKKGKKRIAERKRGREKKGKRESFLFLFFSFLSVKHFLFSLQKYELTILN